MEVAHLLAHPDWANDHNPVKISLCKYVLQLINGHHCEWTVLPSYWLYQPPDFNTYHGVGNGIQPEGISGIRTRIIGV